MLVIACLSDYEDGNDMYSRNIGWLSPELHDVMFQTT
jgi:hypothetical protein